MRGVAVVVCVLALLAPVPAGPQDVPGAAGLDIQHDPVSCFVAGKHPRLLACFSPRSRLARARVFFRAHGTAAWYYVNMTEDSPCFSGVLPRPTVEIERVDYYLEATARDFTESLTREFEPVVVEDESECRGLLAPFLDQAEVIVGSAAGAAGIPQGFAAGGLGGGISTGLVVAGVVGGGAVIGGIAVAGGDGGDGDTPSGDPPVGRPPSAPGPTPTPTPEPTPEPTPAPTPTPAPEPTPTPTPEPPPSPNQPPVLKYNVPASAPKGNPVTFDLCDSFDPEGDPLQYAVHFDDSLNDPNASYSGTACSTQYTYDDAGTFRPEVCVDDDHNPPECVTVVLSIVESFLAADAQPAEPDGGFHQVDPVPEPEAPRAPPEGEIALDSQLAVPGATGQIIVNGSQSHFVGTAPIRVSARGTPGINRVEALLVEGKGQTGTWRLDLAGTRVPVEGLQIVAGETVSVSPSEVVFAVSGRPGERIVFAFTLPDAP